MTEHLMDNPRAERVKKVAALGSRAGRKKQGTFLVEGPQPVREALRLWLGRMEQARVGQNNNAHHDGADAAPLPQLQALYFSAEALNHHPDVAALVEQARAVLFDPQADLPTRRRVLLREASPEVLRAMGDADTSQGLLGVARIPEASADFGRLGSTVVSAGATLGDASRLVPVLLGLQDPGNMGTIIRTADAAGADAVVLTPGSVDPWGPKVVRSAAGSHFHVPIFTGIAVEQLAALAQANRFQVLAADGHGAQTLDRVDAQLLRRPTLWFLGNEAHGISEQQRALADQVVGIPLYGQAESLNVAVAASVCLYASAMAQRESRT